MKKVFIFLFIAFSFTIFCQEKTKEEKKFGSLKVKVSYQSKDVVGVLDDARVFIGKNISLNKKDLRDVRPVILIPVKTGWMYLNGRTEKLQRTDKNGETIFQNLEYGKYKVVIVWWKKEAKIEEVEINSSELKELNVKFLNE